MRCGGAGVAFGLLAVHTVLCSATSTASPEVFLPDGSHLFGDVTYTTRQRRPVYEFRGVRYGTAPGGRHRFKPSKPVGPLGTYDATRFAPPCPPAFDWSNDWFTDPDVEVRSKMRNHTSDEDPEDCLFLNVFTPTLDPDARLAVLVHVHGGSFVAGTALLARPGFMLDHDLLLITIQYRLCVSGFLYLGTEEAPGNMGLGDMLQALRWVQTNIAVFGGDPDRVTVSGGSAGAAAVEFLALSPQSEGLLHRVIAMSGSSHASWALVTPDEAEKSAREMASLIGCASDKPADQLVTCLRETSLENLTHAFMDYVMNRMNGGDDAMAPATPVVQPAHLPEDVRVLPFSPMDACHGRPAATRYNRTAKPLMAGVTKHDGRFFISYGAAVWDSLPPTEERWRTLTAEFITSSAGLDEYNPAVADALYDKYFAPTEKNIDKIFAALTDFVGTTKFKSPMLKSAICSSTQGSATYVYTLSHRGSFRNIAIDHGIDVLYLSPRSDFQLAEEDELVSRRLVHLHANFIMYGDPTPNVSIVEDVPDWKQFSSLTTGHYMRINWPFQLLTDFEHNEFDVALKEGGFGGGQVLRPMKTASLLIILSLSVWLW